ncbi:MAG: hypothetical protein ACXVAN_07375 [Polyangia bacterium]
MRQENSVLFALRDLRSLEDERVAEQQRAEAERQRAEDERQRMEAERRLADEQRQAALGLQRQREHEERQALARALEHAAGRNEQLESDVQTLRALVSAVRPEPVERRLWPFALVAAAGIALAIVLVASQRPVVRERVVYVPAPVATPAPMPPRAEAPPSAVAPPPRHQPPASAAHDRAREKKRLPAPAPKLPEVQVCDGKDPLCGTLL